MAAHLTARAVALEAYRADHGIRGCEWALNDGLRCGRHDLALTGDGPHICFVHLQEFVDVRVARREVTRERFDRRSGALVEIEK